MRKFFVSFVALLVFAIFSASVASRAVAAVASFHYFGVYQTDVNGDVSFKYKGTYQWVMCVNYLPYIPFTPDIYHWNSWVLTDWLPTWKGEKLLVPRTYQVYHQKVYGYPISQALYLVSLY